MILLGCQTRVCRYKGGPSGVCQDNEERLSFHQLWHQPLPGARPNHTPPREIQSAALCQRPPPKDLLLLFVWSEQHSVHNKRKTNGQPDMPQDDFSRKDKDSTPLAISNGIKRHGIGEIGWHPSQLRTTVQRRHKSKQSENRQRERQGSFSGRHRTSSHGNLSPSLKILVYARKAGWAFHSRRIRPVAPPPASGRHPRSKRCKRRSRHLRTAAVRLLSQ